MAQAPAAAVPVALGDGTHPAQGRHLAAAALSPDEATLWVLFSSLELQEEGATPRSWFYAIDTATLAAQGPPLAIPGVAATGFQVLAAALGGHCWVATRTPGTGRNGVRSRCQFGSAAYCSVPPFSNCRVKGRSDRNPSCTAPPFGSTKC